MKKYFLQGSRNIFATTFLLLRVFILPLSAQQTNLKFTNYTINNGLSEGLVLCITQDNQGFMWFGTQDGLDRFDGYEFVVFRHDPFDTTTISSNVITALFTDSRGQLWVGTLNAGLDLFDPKRNRFLHFLVNKTHKGKAGGEYIRSITEDNQGNLWIGTYSNGLFEFLFPKKRKGSLLIPDKDLHYFYHSANQTGLTSNFIDVIYADREGHLWVSHPEGIGLQEVNLDENKISFSTPSFTVMVPESILRGDIIQYDLTHVEYKKPAPDAHINYIFFEDADHDLWIGGGEGLYLLKDGTDTLLDFSVGFPSKLSFNTILSICKGGTTDNNRNNLLWVGTWPGAGLFNPQNLTLQLIHHQLNDNESLLAGTIRSIYRDRSGSIWLGTNGYGVSKFNFHSTLFSAPLYSTPNKDLTTADLSILSLFENKNYIALGSYDSTWIINKNNGIMKKAKGIYLVDDMLAADSGKVWMAGFNGLTLYNPGEGNSILYSPGISSAGNKSDQIIKLYKSSKGGLWALTPYCFSYFDTRKKTFTNYYYNHNYQNITYYPSHGAIYKDDQGNFWLGSEKGLLYFDTTKKTFQQYVNHPSDTSSISYNVVECIVPDPRQPRKYLWIGTAGGGLNKFNLLTKKFVHFTIKDGLPNNVINGILTDDHGNLWISTNNGISKFNPANNTFHNYDVRKGLTSNEFNPGAYYKNETGEFFFGNIKGFNTFYPDSIFNSSYIPPVVFTDFRLFNKPVIIGDKNSPLKRSISETKILTLPYHDNLITFQVAALDYSEPDKNQYAYRLIGFNKNWINVGNDRLITFSNLDPGHYTLQVKASNSDGVWNEKGVSLAIHILPPWWRTLWAYILYVLIALLIIWIVRRAEINRLKLKNSLALEQSKLALEQSRLALEHQEAEKLKEIDHLKSRFFANISHEFRIPLTLIIGPLKDMMQGGLPDKFASVVPAMYRNSQRLLQLINQLLDLSKLDSGNYQINTTRTDIVSFVKQITSIFLNLAKRKQIKLDVQVEEILVKELHSGKTYFYFDEDVVEKVLTNLISNALKFTQEDGHIEVLLALEEKDKNYVSLKVKDDGTGIPSEKLPYVFDRFYQADDSSKRKYEGSGIGLALVKELMTLHGGNISAESNPKTGTVFTCLFPFNKKIISVEKKTAIEKPDKDVATGKEKSTISPGQIQEDGKPLVLVVEDNPDVRQYICDKLKGEYSLTECKNGQEGLEAALNGIPDVVISDVMMPEMDGFELCRKLKTDNRTSHIPVILLTARAEDADKLKGLETGADAYLIKPFNAMELRIRIDKLIEIRNKLRAKFSGNIIVRPSEIAVSSLDKEFITKLKNATENQIGNSDFKVETLSKEMNMSVSQLNRKLRAIINQTTSQYITTLRMHRALELLKKNGDSVSEVAWKTGFEDPGYFSKVFKNYFGCLPSEKEKFPINA